MDKEIQDQLDRYMKQAQSITTYPESTGIHHFCNDGLSKVLRTKKDAEDFMAEFNLVVERSK